MINTNLIALSTESLLLANSQIVEARRKLGLSNDCVRIPADEGKRIIEALNFLIISNDKEEFSAIRLYLSTIHSNKPTPAYKRVYDILMIATAMVEEL